MTQQRPRVLVVDDDFSVRDSMQKWLEMDGYDVVGAEDASIALGHLERERFDVALVDIRMPGMSGVELQRRISLVDPDLPLVIITAYASIQTAVEVLKRGAMDYLTKPVDPDDLSRLVRRALQRRESLARGQDDATSAVLSQALVGQTEAMQRVRKLAAEAARSDQPVLIVGEQGTGRHATAAAIHASSRRRFFDLVPLDCAPLAVASFERQLFGAGEGNDGAALRQHKGRLHLARNGTLLLESIDELPHTLQGALLDVLERPMVISADMGQQPDAVDFRPIAIGRQPLRPLVEAGEFSERLYFRLAILVIEMPPLRACMADIPQIADALLGRVREQDATLEAIEGLSPDAVTRLLGHNWPGNVAELAGVLRRAAAVATPPVIDAADLGQLDRCRG